MEPDYKGAFEYVFMVLYRTAHLNATKIIKAEYLGHLIPEIRKKIREEYGIETHRKVLVEERESGYEISRFSPNRRERERMGGEGGRVE